MDFCPILVVLRADLGQRARMAHSRGVGVYVNAGATEHGLRPTGGGVLTREPGGLGAGSRLTGDSPAGGELPPLSTLTSDALVHGYTPAGSRPLPQPDPHNAATPTQARHGAPDAQG